MRAIFRICGNESQPGLQLVKKLATPLKMSAVLDQGGQGSGTSPFPTPTARSGSISSVYYSFVTFCNVICVANECQ